MTLIVFLLGVTAVSATDADNTQNIQTNNQELQDNINTQQLEKQSTTQIQSENTKTIKKVETTSKNTDLNTKTIKNKTNKEVKKAENTSVTVNNGNYFTYFNSRGRMLAKIEPNTTVILSGEFTDKSFEISKAGIYFTGDDTNIIKNGQIRIAENAIGSTVTNLNIQIMGTDITAAINNQALNTTISNNNITFFKETGEVIGIKNSENNLKILNNNITVQGPDANIDWSGFSDKAGEVNTTTIKSLNAENVIISGNTLNASKSPNTGYSEYGTIDGVELKGSFTNVVNNTIYLSGARYGYALTATAFQYSNITNNKIIIEGNRYINGIQVADGVTNVTIANNEIKGVCNNTTVYKDDNEAMAYGIITSSMGGSSSQNVNVYNNTIDLQATIGYGMEIYKTSNANITGNKVKVNGVYASGISLAHSPNCYIIDNKINTTGDSRVPTNEVIEEIIPANKGIGIQQESANTIVRGNIVNSTDAGNNAYALFVNRTNDIFAENNTFDTNTQQGANAMGYSNSTNVTQNNTNTAITGKKTVNITVNIPSKIVAGTKINLTATVIDSKTGNSITKGVVVFKLDGKTLKSTNGSKIRLNNDGKATIEIDTIILSTTKQHNISAVFGNNPDYDGNRVEYKNISIEKATIITPTINSSNIYTGDKLVINKTLTDKNGRQLIGKNKIAIKFNGKTIQHTTITDGKLNIAIQIPLTKARDNNKIEIIIGENNYYKTARLNFIVNLKKQDTTLSVNKVSAHAGEYITFKVTIKTKQTNNNALNGKIALKIDGKTQKDMDEQAVVKASTISVSNGQATIRFYLPLNIKPGKHNVTVVFSGTNYMQQARYTTDALTILK